MTSPIGAISSATNIHKGMLVFTQTTQVQSSTEYMMHGVLGSTTEADVQAQVPGMVFTAMRVEVASNIGGSGQSLILTLRDDGSDTALTVTIATGAQSGSITGESVAVAAGSLLSVSSVASATSGTVVYNIVLEYTVDT